MSMYGMNRKKGSMSLAGVGGGVSIISPTTGKNIPAKEVVVPSSEVLGRIYKCKWNTRSIEFMTPATVMDILGSIREAGRNIIPGIAVQGDDGKYEIISGMKRSYAVSLSPGANLILHVADELSEEDKQKLAYAADLTEKPSNLDIALTLKDMKAELGDKFNVRDAAAAIGISKSAAAEFLKFADLPKELMSLFPGAGYVSWRFLREVVATGRSNEEIVNAIEAIAPIASDVDKVLSENAADTLKVESKELESKVLDLLKKKRKATVKSFDENSPLHKNKLVKGVEAKPGSKGAVSLTLKKEFLDSEVGKSLLKLISPDS